MRYTHFVTGAVLFTALACSSGVAPPVETIAKVAPTAGAEGLCAEHGVLEAVCTKCNPSLIPVFQAKGDWCAEHSFPESFCPICHPERGGRPATNVASDGSPADGLKIRFKTRETVKLAGIHTAVATAAADEGGVEAVARLSWDGTRQALVSAPTSGLVETVKVDVGSWVKRGETLCTISGGRGNADKLAFEAARTDVTLAEQSLERKKLLQDVVSAVELREAEQTVAAAKADLEASRYQQGHSLTTPIAGVVTRREVTAGMAVNPGSPAFEVVDPSRLWAEIEVPESEVSAVKIGQTVSLELDGVPEKVKGSIDYVAPYFAPDTRTALARVSIDNTAGLYRANMFGTAWVSVGGSREVVVVPENAVQRAKSVEVVFIRRTIDEFETRRVKVVKRQGGMVFVSGLSPGEEVATEGSFVLKTEILKDSIGAGCCDVE